MALNIGVIISSTREGRNGPKIVEWFKESVAERSDMNFTYIDLAEVNLPFFNEPVSPAYSDTAPEVAKDWAEQIDGLDGFVVITAEYNHGPTAVLKNALDYLYRQWNRKPIAFVGYGSAGGTRAVEQLRLIAIELQMAPIRHQVALNIFEYFNEDGSLAIPAGKKGDLDIMLNDLAWWATALSAARQTSRKA